MQQKCKNCKLLCTHKPPSDYSTRPCLRAIKHHHWKKTQLQEHPKQGFKVLPLWHSTSGVELRHQVIIFSGLLGLPSEGLTSGCLTMASLRESQLKEAYRLVSMARPMPSTTTRSTPSAAATHSGDSCKHSTLAHGGVHEQACSCLSGS